MKRNLFFILFVIAMAILLISCGGTRTCSYAETKKTNPNPNEVTTEVELVVTE